MQKKFYYKLQTLQRQGFTWFFTVNIGHYYFHKKIYSNPRLYCVCSFHKEYYFIIWVEIKYYDQHQSYIKVSIPIIEKQKILSKYTFSDDYDIQLTGKVNQCFIYKSPLKVYHIINKGIGLYSYKILVLKIEEPELEMYDFYGD